MRTTCFDKKDREHFVERFLNGDSTVEEEHAFAQFFREADVAELTDEEKKVAALLTYAPEALPQSPDMRAAAEFDRIFPEKTEKKGHKGFPLMHAVAATLVAAVAMCTFLTLKPADGPSEKDGDAWSLTALCESIADIFPNAASINIERSADTLLVTIRNDDGSNFTFSMDRESLQDKGRLKLKAVTKN